MPFKLYKMRTFIVLRQSNKCIVVETRVYLLLVCFLRLLILKNTLNQVILTQCKEDNFFFRYSRDICSTTKKKITEKLFEKQ